MMKDEYISNYIDYVNKKNRYIQTMIIYPTKKEASDFIKRYAAIVKKKSDNIVNLTKEYIEHDNHRIIALCRHRMNYGICGYRIDELIFVQDDNGINNIPEWMMTLLNQQINCGAKVTFI